MVIIVMWMVVIALSVDGDDGNLDSGKLMRMMVILK